MKVPQMPEDVQPHRVQPLKMKYTAPTRHRPAQR
jgi:hypothetical protein